MHANPGPQRQRGHECRSLSPLLPSLAFRIVVVLLAMVLGGCYGSQELADRWREQPKSEDPVDRYIADHLQQKAESRRPKPLRRMGAMIEIDPSRVEEYRELNVNPPPGVKEALAQYGVERCSIFLSPVGDRTFAFRVIDYRGGNWELDRTNIETDPILRAWQEEYETMQIPVSPRASGSWWADAEEVFRMPEENADAE